MTEGGIAPPAPHPFMQKASGQIFKDDVNGFSSTSDDCCMPYSRLALG
jgi:hypothetical protein